MLFTLTTCTVKEVTLTCTPVYVVFIAQWNNKDIYRIVTNKGIYISKGSLFTLALQ